MLKNYLTSVWRYIVRNKAFTFINLFGLAIGMTACMLIAQFVLGEFSYDSFWKNSDKIYRVQQDRYDKGELSTRWASGCLGVGPDLKANFPEVKHYVRMTKSNAVLSNGTAFFKEENVYYASKDFFQVFSVQLLEGIDTTALKEPNTMVISRSLARKYFGDENVLGKHLKNNGRVEYKITGVFEDLPTNTHMQVDALLSFATYAILIGQSSEEALTQWQWDGFLTYLLLNENAEASALEAKFPEFVERMAGEELKRFNAGQVFHLQALTDIHLDSDFIGEFKPNGNRDTTYFLLIVAVLIIIIAWINYVNLSTAKSIERAREVGVRKVMGGFRSQLIKQFLFESLLLNSLAVGISIALVLLLIPWFSELTGREVSYVLFQNALFWLWIGVLIVGGTLLSGLYPAFVLSGYKPVEVLKGRFKNSGQGVFFRKGMVVTQFVASITLIAGTFTVYQQITYMHSQELGVDIEQTLILRAPNIVDSTYQQKYEVFKNTLLQYPEVSMMSAATDVPGAAPDWNAGGIRRISQREDEANQYRVIQMEADFIKQYGLEVVSGRSFDNSIVNEEQHVLLNESAARLMGYEKIDDAINDQIDFWGDTFRIVGVVKNYRHESLKKAFDPMIFRYAKAPGGFYSVKFNTKEVKESLAKFESDWKEFFPGNPFTFFFLDDHYNQQYKADKQFGQVFGIFSALAIFIACLGLFGLSSLMAIQRTKEVGVRKVLGASVPGLLILMSKEYVILMAIAIVLSIPLTGLIMNNWLQDFANRIALEWWLFAGPSAAVIFIALLTVSAHTLKTARTNPVKSLRYE